MSKRKANDDKEKEKASIIQKAILTKLRDNDTSALADVMEAYGENVKKILRLRFKPFLTDLDIDEAISEALFALWQKRSTIIPSRRLGGWFYVVSRNIAIDRLKKMQRFPMEIGSQVNQLEAKNIATNEFVPAKPKDAFFVNKLVPELQPIEREILYAYANSISCGRKDWSGDLSKSLGMTSNTLRVRLSRIKKKIAKRMAEAGFPPNSDSEENE